LEQYEHGGDVYGHPGVRLDFSVSTNPLGLPDQVRRALVSRADEYEKYPDPKCRELRHAISRKENVPEDWILCGGGAADLIYRLCYAVKPREALVCAPSFSEYGRALEQAGCKAKYHFLPEEKRFELTGDIEKKITPDTDMIFLCHPNNPTGRLIPGNLLGRVISLAGKNRAVTVVDECFLDFTNGDSAKSYLENSPGLVILKAFTKFYSMAGLRLGYLMTRDKALLNGVRDAGQCWSVSVPAQIAGVAALSGQDWAEKTRRLVREERRFLSEGLRDLGLTVFPSDANFLLFRSEKPLYTSLLRKGILIRSCENFKGLDLSYFRVGVKTRAENIALTEAVKEIVYG
jgi:threonine-phosphate decarboxylase